MFLPKWIFDVLMTNTIFQPSDNFSWVCFVYRDMADPLACCIGIFDWLVAISTKNRLYPQDSKLAPRTKSKSLAAAITARTNFAARRRSYRSPKTTNRTRDSQP
jgi:hypothetical protein